MEIMLAFSILTLFIVSTIYLNTSVQQLKIWSIKELERMEDLTIGMDTFTNLSHKQLGNYTKIWFNDLFSVSISDYQGAWGQDSCNLQKSIKDIALFKQGVNIGSNNPSTDIEARNGIVYMSTDSTSSSVPDVYILDASIPSDISILSSINTGPGVSALEVVGPYIFTAQSSTVSQFQIIDIHDRMSPKLLSQLKLPLPTPTTTAPFATAITYSNGYVYLGTMKWEGSELSIIDVRNIANPKIVGSLETNTLINDIAIIGNTAYVAGSDEKQIRVVDITNKAKPQLIVYLSPSGWQTQEGKVIDYYEDRIGFGRTVGGFNVSANHEAFIMSTTSIIQSKDVPGGVYGLIIRPEYTFLLTHNTGREFQVWDSDIDHSIMDVSLGSQPVKMACDSNDLYFATGDKSGLYVLRIEE